MLRDRRMLFVVIAIPVVQLLLFGFAISTEVNDIAVCVAYGQGGSNAGAVTERLEHNPYVTLRGRVPQSEVHATLQAGLADAVVVFGAGGDVQIVTDASNPNMAQAAASYLEAIIAGGRGPDVPVDTRFLYNPRLRSAYNFVPGIMGMLFLLVCALMTAVAIVREKETGTLELLLVSPTPPAVIIISKMVPFFVLSCLDLAMVLLIARYLLYVPLSGGVAATVGVSLLYIMLSLAFGLLVSTIARSQVVAMLVCGMVMIMPVVMLSGMIFPVDNLPPVLSQISCAVPARWYIDAMRKLMIQGVGFGPVLIDVAVLAVMLAALLAVAMRNFKTRAS